MSNQIATHNTNEKKAGQAELTRKLDANVRVTNFRVLFAAYHARVQGPSAGVVHACVSRTSRLINNKHQATGFILYELIDALRRGWR